MRVVLASTSRYRRALVRRIGIDVACVAPACDEDALKPGLAHLPPGERAKALARAKADSVAALDPDALVIGSDQIAELDGEALSKPGSLPVAARQLGRLAGRTHRLHTAVALVHRAAGLAEVALDVTALTMRALDEAAIADYLTRDEPFDCAGSYKIESLGVALFERVETEDPSAIEGLPLMRLVAMLGRFGVRVLG